MIQMSLWSKHQLIAPVDSQKHLDWRVVKVQPFSEEKCRWTRQSKNILEQGNLLTNRLNQELDRMNVGRESLIDNFAAPLEPMSGGPTVRSRRMSMVESTMTQVLSKLDTQFA